MSIILVRLYLLVSQQSSNEESSLALFSPPPIQYHVCNLLSRTSFPRALSSIRDTNDISSPRYTHTLGWGADPLFSCHQRSEAIQLGSSSPVFGAHRREYSTATLRKVYNFF